MIDARHPFVLLDDARAEGAAPARFYSNPKTILAARGQSEVRARLAQLRTAPDEGLHAAGFLSYEAGHALEPRLADWSAAVWKSDPPHLWFGLFERFETIAAADVPALLPDPASAWATAPRPLMERDHYGTAVARVMRHIKAGDIYQANLTFQAEINTAGDPLALYAGLRSRAGAWFGAVVFTGQHWLLSFSPELFFTLEGPRLTTRPMKGTARRRIDPAGDTAAIQALRDDPKQRAENLMIVDLLRNDLSRVSKPGSVAVPELFAVETYPTIHQMTSTVTAEIEDGLGAIDVIEAIFPCGSITGAPKIRAMEIIGEIERAPRGAYCGAIGRLDVSGDAAFNVAIRTLTMKVGENRALIGLGSGIVADSEASDEWRECLAKGAFVNDGARRFDLIETMRFDPDTGVAELDRHLERMKTSADALGFVFDRHGARNELQAATFRLGEAKMIRLMLSATGALAIESRAVPESSDQPVAVALMPLPVASSDFRLRHKTSDRAFYDEALATAGTFEVVFADRNAFLTEGSFTNLFVERAGRFLTPPLSRGLLPGVLRGRLLASGEAVETDLVVDDLVDGFFVGNAVRGLICAVLH